MAEVGAVGQVVGAQRADEGLVEEGGLVAGAAACVEGGAMGRFEPAERAAERGEELLPGDGAVVGIAVATDHRLGDAALAVEPEVALCGERCDAVCGEPGSIEPLRGGLVCHMLCAVLAELGEGAVVAFGPGAAGAVEALLLVQLSERGEAPREAALGQCVADGCSERAEAAGVRGAAADAGRVVAVDGDERVAWRGVGSCRHAVRRRVRRSGA